MKVFKSLVIGAIILLSTSTSLYATDTYVGCQINSQSFMYQEPVGPIEYVVNPWYKPTFQTYMIEHRIYFEQGWYDYNNCPHFSSQPAIGSPQCAVQGITYADANGVHNLGNTVTFSLVYPNCTETTIALPLDDYTWAILLAVGALGAFIIIKKQLIAL